MILEVISCMVSLFSIIFTSAVKSLPLSQTLKSGVHNRIYHPTVHTDIPNIIFKSKSLCPENSMSA